MKIRSVEVHILNNREIEPGAMTQAYDPNNSGGFGRKNRELKASLVNIAGHLSQKNKKRKGKNSIRET